MTIAALTLEEWRALAFIFGALALYAVVSRR